MLRRMLAVSAVLAAMLAVAPVASAHRHHGDSARSYGATTLTVDPGTLAALGSLGVSPGTVPPAQLNGATYSFPITNSLRSALRTGAIRHTGPTAVGADTDAVLEELGLRRAQAAEEGRR